MSFRHERYTAILAPDFGRALEKFLLIVTRRPSENELLSCSASLSHIAFASVVPDRWILTLGVQASRIAVVARACCFS